LHRFRQSNQARCSNGLRRAKNGLSPVASLTSARMLLMTDAEQEQRNYRSNC
jgi:hypothetical protein